MLKVSKAVVKPVSDSHSTQQEIAIISVIKPTSDE